MLGKFKAGFGPDRIVSHLILALVCLAGGWSGLLIWPDLAPNEGLALGSGYLALLLLVITLLIGPLNLLVKRSNPVNLNLRRDVAIWSGIAGLLHVFFGFQIYEGGQLLQYFFTSSPGGPGLQWNLFGLNNLTGLVATVIMLALLLLSNQLSLRLLKGKRWKFWQRFTYPLFGLVVIHTAGYQIYGLRESFYTYFLLGLTFAVIAGQLAGVVITVRRKSRRQAQIGEVLPPAPVTMKLARRRFLVITGSTLMTSVAVGLVGRRLSSPPENLTLSVEAALPATATPVPATPTPSPLPTRRSRGNSGNNFPPGPNNGPNSGQPSRGNPNRGPAPTAQAAPITPASSPATSASGPVLATVASMPVGSALKFTTPDSGEPAFLFREADWSFKAFNGLCTHRPYNLVFDSSQQMLVCHLHNVPFDLQTGAPTRFPARSPLQQYTVSVDGKGNVIYQSA